MKLEKIILNERLEWTGEVLEWKHNGVGITCLARLVSWAFEAERKYEVKTKERFFPN